MISWDEKYNTDVHEIDIQHKWIFNFTNDLERELSQPNHQRNVGEILSSIESYTKKHFKFEEECMHKWQCPFAKENKCAHEKLIFAYDNFMERYKREGHSDELAWKIHDLVEKWLVNHICKIDIHLKSCSKTIHQKH